MQVHSIQENETTYNCRKTNFAAKFIMDHNGYINCACNNAKFTKNLKKNINTFSKYFPNTELEILNIEKNNFTPNYVYDVYNHSTGKTVHLILPNDIKHKNSLDKMLSKINTLIKNCDNFFFTTISGDVVKKI